MKLFELSLFSLSLTQKRRFPPPDPGHVREAEVHLAFAKRQTPQSPGSTQLGVTAGDGGAKLFPETAMSHSGDEHADPSSETRKSHINITNDNRFINVYIKRFIWQEGF